MHWKSKVTIFLILMAIVIAYPFITIKYFETETPLKITAKYFLGPIVVFLCLFGPKFYFSKIKSLDNFKSKSKSKEKSRDIFAVVMMVLYSSMLFFGLLFSLIIITNTFGTSQTVMIRETVLKYRPEVTRNGKLRHHIEINNPRTHEDIHLEVYREYKQGEIFEKKMKYGLWGILYSKE